MNKIFTHGNRESIDTGRFGRPVEVGMEVKRHMLYSAMDKSNFIQVDSVVEWINSFLFT